MAASLLFLTICSSPWVRLTRSLPRLTSSVRGGLQPHKLSHLGVDPNVEKLHMLLVKIRGPQKQEPDNDMNSY